MFCIEKLKPAWLLVGACQIGSLWLTTEAPHGSVPDLSLTSHAENGLDGASKSQIQKRETYTYCSCTNINSYGVNAC